MASFKVLAASLLIVGGLAWFGSGNGTLAPTALADVIPGVDNVQAMTWTDTYYIRVTSQDRQRTWLRRERKLNAYLHPGLYRETWLDDNDQPISVHITDLNAGRMLALDMKNKQAVLKLPDLTRDQRGPFAWVGDLIRERKFGDNNRVKSISLQGKREVDKNQANVVRAVIESDGNRDPIRVDCLFDVTSKRLVGIWTPNGDFDPDTADDRDNKPEKTWHMVMPVAALTHEVVLDTKFDPSEFSLDPPAGYALEKTAKPTVTEEEMITYLGAAARFNDNVFPDSPYDPFDVKKFNAASEKDATARTEVEQSLIDIRDKIMLREIYRSPVKQFLDDHAAAESFHYVGSGVKVGDAERIVCWYKLRDSKTARAVHGDLSVKDVTDADLPLNLSN